MKRTLKITTCLDGTYEVLEFLQYAPDMPTTLEGTFDCHEIIIDGKNLKKSGD